MGEVHYMISEAAKRVNVETHVLRYWEEELTLSIGRTEMGHRYYTEEDIQLFRRIKELKEQGMQLKELKCLVPDILRTREQLRIQKEKTESVRAEVVEEALQVVEQPVREQEDIHIGEMLKNTMLENNKLLEECINKTVTKAIIQEMNYLLQAQDRQEEERYKKLDSLIRQQQILRRESARPAPVKRLRKLFEM